MVFFTSRGLVAYGTSIGDIDEGTVITLNESGSPVELYVSKQDYESSLNGPGRALVVRKDVYDNRAWDSGNVNAYASSDIDAWFNGTYKALLDPSIQTAIGTTKFYYTPGNGNNTVSTLERAVFGLSLAELGKSSTSANVEGSALPIASTLQIAHRNGSTSDQWTRSPNIKNTLSPIYLYIDGSVFDNYAATSKLGSRPCFTLPSTLLFNPDTNEVVA